MTKDLLAPIPFREVFVILALFLPQLTFLDGTRAQQNLWASAAVKQRGLQVDITPTGLASRECMSTTSPFPHGLLRLQHLPFDQLADRNSNDVHMGCQVGKVYRLVLEEGERVYSALAILLAFTTAEEGRCTCPRFPTPVTLLLFVLGKRRGDC